MKMNEDYEKEYVLLTAVRNEERYISGTIESVISQTRRPLKWVIVSDNSIDKTENIVEKYAQNNKFIQIFRSERKNKTHSYSAKAKALKIGYEQVKNDKYGYIGILDGDVTFSIDYYEKNLFYMGKDERLGIIGGFVYEKNNCKYSSRKFNNVESVAGAVQLFKRECYENIGGIFPLHYGGEDTIAEVIARMKGWKVKSFPEMIVYHHKVGINKRGAIYENIRKGMMDYSIGVHPIYEVMRCINRLRETPMIFGGIFRLIGFVIGYIFNRPRSLNDDVLKYFRKEQLSKIRKIILKKIWLTE